MEKEKKHLNKEEHHEKHEEHVKQIEKLELALKEEQAKSMRIQAEMLNFKKRKEDEVASFYKYCNEDLIEELLPVIDNFERAIKLDDTNLSDELSKFLEGFKMIYTHLVEVLKKFEVTEIECLNKEEVKEIEASGIEFDPNYHQAVLTEHDETKPSGVVLEVLQKGYTYKDKVIRPAMVKVNE